MPQYSFLCRACKKEWVRPAHGPRWRLIPRRTSNMNRSKTLSGGFELVIYIKQVNAEVEAALAEAVKLEKEEGPRREAERQKKEIDALEVTRQKNHKSFRP